jgi:hypothetical protein
MGKLRKKWLNKLQQFFILDPLFAFVPILELIIPDSRYLKGSAHLFERKDRTVIIYEAEPYPVGFENMPTAFFKMARSIHLPS